MWKFRDNTYGRQSNIFSKFLVSVIEIDERNQPTKFYLGNINITSFIKVLRNAPHEEVEKVPKMKNGPKNRNKTVWFRVYKGGQITVLFSITPLFQELRAFEISNYSKIAGYKNFSKI